MRDWIFFLVAAAITVSGCVSPESASEPGLAPEASTLPESTDSAWTAIWLNGTVMADAGGCSPDELLGGEVHGHPVGDRQGVPQEAVNRTFIGPQAYGGGILNGPVLCLYWIGVQPDGTTGVLGSARTTVSGTGQGVVPAGTTEVIVRGDSQLQTTYWLYIGEPAPA